jgi:hypothetical protein
MQCGVRRRTIGSKGCLDISPEQFSETKTAWRGLIQALGVEENFDILNENYFEFENELLGMTLRNMIFSDRDWLSSKSEIHLVDRRIINFLTTSRLYLDQMRHTVSSRFGDPSEEFTSFTTKLSDEYDSSLGYRAVEAMRNFVQHRGLAVFSLSLTASKHDMKCQTSKRTIAPSLSVSHLKQEGGFKSAVLAELELLGDSVNLKPLIRQAMEALGRIHAFVRQSWASDVAQWDKTIEGIMSAYSDRIDRGEFPLSVFAVDETGEKESVSIFADLIKRRRWLVDKNTTLPRYNSEIISSESEAG